MLGQNGTTRLEFDYHRIFDDQIGSESRDDIPAEVNIERNFLIRQ
jgi:hypothetical protein